MGVRGRKKRCKGGQRKKKKEKISTVKTKEKPQIRL